MKWEETIASKCRYGECVGEIFGGMEIVGEDIDDHCAYAGVLAVDLERRFHYYEWHYGLRSGWDADGLSRGEILAEIGRTKIVLGDEMAALRHFAGDGDCCCEEPLAGVLREWILGNREQI